MPRCLVIQHDPDGPIGLAGERLAHHGFEFDTVAVMRETWNGTSDAIFPDPTAYDLVLSLGSVQAVYDREAIGAWIDDELAMLRRAHEQGVPVLGLCFGGQALAAALGGTVSKSPVHEIGWITLDTDVPDLIPAGPWFAWHIDRFTVPPGATELARTELCPHAFRLGRSVGFQFHPEVDETIVKQWLAFCDDSYFESKGITRDDVIANTNHDGAREAFFRIVDWMVTEVAVSPPEAAVQ